MDMRACLGSALAPTSGVRRVASWTVRSGLGPPGRLRATADFLRAYVRSMRLYYSFITGIAGWLGVAYYEHLQRTPWLAGIEEPLGLPRKLTILAILFLSWGVNQVINDYLGLAADRINAPDRPMVNGQLHPEGALALSVGLILAAGVVTWVWLEPMAVVFLAAGVLLNILYEQMKARGLLGNLVFGLMIAMAPLYGAYACGPTNATLLLSHRLSVLILVVVLNGLMTYYTYFKDYRGDLLTGKHTLVVRMGMQRSRQLALWLALLPAGVFLLLRWTGLHQSPLTPMFLVLGSLTVLLHMQTGWRYWKQPSGAAAYRSLRVNFQACAGGQAALIALFDPTLGAVLFVASYLLVRVLFGLHSNPRQ